jgi:hypothetical protein
LQDAYQDIKSVPTISGAEYTSSVISNVNTLNSEMVTVYADLGQTYNYYVDSQVAASTGDYMTDATDRADMDNSLISATSADQTMGNTLNQL